MPRQQIELLRPCWRDSTKRMPRSTAYSQMCAIEALGGHICRCAVRTAGDLYLWRYVRARDYVQCPQADARHGRVATPWREGGRGWLSHGVHGEPGERVTPARSKY